MTWHLVQQRDYFTFKSLKVGVGGGQRLIQDPDTQVDANILAPKILKHAISQ